MNIHVPQTQLTKAELLEIMLISKNIVSPQSNKPVIGIVQDALLGCFRIAHKDVFLTKAEFMNIMMALRDTNFKVPTPAILLPEPLWTGKQVYDLILPDINFNRNCSFHAEGDTKSFSKDDSEVIIRKGKLLSGQMCKKSLGTSEGSIIHTIWLQHGSEQANRFISGIQFLVNSWLVNTGFSIGAVDIFTKTDIQDKVKNCIVDAKEKAKQIIQVGQRNNLKRSQYESKINQVMNNAMSASGKTVQDEINQNNNIHTMVTGGSKGSIINIAQIMACVGQQNVGGKRVEMGYMDRVLPHFEAGNLGPEAKGFVENSYKTGLKPHEFFYHAMGGREGIIDTAIKSVTGDTGIVYNRNGITCKQNIGDLIDDLLDSNKEKIKYHDSSQANMELLDVSEHDIYIPTTTNEGKVSWEKIQNISRHDPSEMIYIIETKYGRNVKVVESKSLLIWNKEIEEFEPKLSKEVKIGDFVPVTHNLPNFNEISSIDMTKYLNKNEFIYGTDFNIAHNLIFDVHDGNVPRFWWGKNNGTTFTLPYEHAHRMLRVDRRSNISNIKDGFIFPYRGKRTEAMIPDTFELTRENGFFLGIYIAEGCSHIKSGKVQISNNEVEIQKIVTAWFDNHNIKSKLYSEKKTHGTSNDNQGYSTVLAKFLIMFVGHGAQNKRIPSEVFSAPDIFVKGLLDGYFSGDGCITKNSIEASSASYELIEGISMLLSRFGIFSKTYHTELKSNNFGTKNILTSYRLTVRSNFAVKLSETIKLTHIQKQEKLDLIRNSKTILKYEHLFDTRNDVILDEISKITIINSTNFPKVYDFTVPSTLNFGLSNGLHVYDTSETGYIQRKLIKSMEDIGVVADGTVRNSIGDIVQYMYGEDGMDATYLVTESIDTCSENFDCRFVHGNAPIQEIEELKSAFENLKNFKHKSFKSPINMKMIKPYFKSEYSETAEFPDSQYIFDNIQKVCTSFTIFNKTNPIHSEMETAGLSLIKFYTRTILASKVVLSKNWTKEYFIYVCDCFMKQFNCATAKNGEMIGTVAAQSVGEVTTQLTLNTFHTAGVSAKNVTLGVPRFKEIINVAKNMKAPSMVLYLKEGNNPEKIAEEIEYTTLSMMKEKMNVVPKDTSSIYFELQESETEYVDYMVRYTLDRDKVRDKGASLLKISVNLMKEYNENILVLYNDNILDVYIIKPEEQELTRNDVFILGNKIQHTTVYGNSGITKTYVNSPDDVVIETEGSCLFSFIDDPRFDFSKCISNNIIEVKEILGIEAARAILIEELRKVIEFDGGYVNLRHFYLLADTMTYRGDLMSITRHGINRGETGPLMKCSFEETVDVLVDAAVHSDIDKLSGVTENVCVGKMARIGTGNFDLIHDFETNSKSSKLNEEDYIESTLDTSDSDDEYIESYISDSD